MDAAVSGLNIGVGHRKKSPWLCAEKGRLLKELKELTQ